MQPNYASFNGLPLIISAPKLAVSYLWHAQDHSILRDVFFGARYIVKLLAISQTIHTVCCEDDYFQTGNLKLFNSMFQSVYLVFSKKFFFPYW